jgi:hypothetical protein
MVTALDNGRSSVESPKEGAIASVYPQGMSYLTI